MAKQEIIDYHGYIMTKKYDRNVFMMATTAFHLTGDLITKEPSLCLVCGEYFNEDARKNYYVGCWVGGHAFNVRFPKETTRELTDEEKKSIENK